MEAAPVRDPLGTACWTFRALHCRRRWFQALAIAFVACLVTMACGSASVQRPATDVPAPSPATTASISPTPPLPAVSPGAPSPTVDERPDEPLGLPIDPELPAGWVDYSSEDRPVQWNAGPGAAAYSRDYQPGEDELMANAGGWNCRVHVAFEGRPAVDWYIPVGTPIRSTMDGTATLFAITTTNAFDYYDRPRAPYVGFPMPAASVSPFPGPGGGKGVYVEVRNQAFVTESAHLSLAPTLAVVPGDAFLPGFESGAPLVERFAPMRSYLDATAIATWSVRRGDVIGFSGDSGYSEAPHLHYTVRRTGGGLICPTAEDGFADGGWLFR